MLAPPRDYAGLLRDIAAWVDRESEDGNTVPDFWDDLSTSERLAEYLFDLGYVKQA
jgi:hypothetical protein